MPGRGVDQILRHSCEPRLEEGYAKDAHVYVQLAEQRSGPIPRQVDPAYVWGDALPLLAAEAPHARVINLETSITRSEERWPAKGIHYRLHPANVDVLHAAGIDVCVLANNHVLDHGRSGLVETLGTLREARLATAGAGIDLAEARAPAERPLPGGGWLRVHAVGAADSGIPDAWAAAPGRPGVDLVPELTVERAAELAARVRATRRSGDVAVVSVHHAPDEARWLAGVLDVESGGLGVRVLADAAGVLRVERAPAH